MSAMRSVSPIPNFSLYGETPVPASRSDSVHIEDIQSRSRKYLWKIGTHRHGLLSQCLWVAAGPVAAVLDDARAVLSGPAVIVIPAGTVHSFKFGSDTQGYVLSVDLAQLIGAANPAHRVPIESLYAVPRAIDLRADAATSLRLGQLLEMLAREFILWILAMRAPRLGSSDPAVALDASRLKRFRTLIESHYLEHWPVRRYAGRLGVSETSLNRVCRRMTGGTAFELIQQRLGLEARRRLAYGALAVVAVAAELGFKDPAYFSRFFRRQSGFSPVEFRRRHGG